MTLFTRSYCTCWLVSLPNTRRSWFGCHMFVFALSVESHRSVANHWKVAVQPETEPIDSTWRILTLSSPLDESVMGWPHRCVCVCVYLHTVNVNDILVLVRMVSGQRCYDVLWAVEKFRLCLHDFMSLWITSSIHSLYLHLCHFCSDCVFKQTKNITVLCSEVLSIPDYFLFSQSTQCSHWHCFITDLFWSKTTAFFLLSKS